MRRWQRRTAGSAAASTARPFARHAQQLDALVGRAPRSDDPALRLEPLQHLGERRAIECDQCREARGIDVRHRADRRQRRVLDRRQVEALGLQHEQRDRDLLQPADQVSGLAIEVTQRHACSVPVCRMLTAHARIVQVRAKGGEFAQVGRRCVDPPQHRLDSDFAPRYQIRGLIKDPPKVHQGQIEKSGGMRCVSLPHLRRLPP